MDFVSWKESYTVGNEQIDHEHMVFIKIIGRIHEEIEKQKPIEDIKRIINELEAYAIFHFISEENIMIDCKFSEFTEHKKEHRELLNTLGAKLIEISSEEEHPRNLIPFLLDWFILHTTRRDLELAKHLASIA